MVIDILLMITFLLAIYKGWSKGVILGVFSLAALVLGLAAALKLSAETGLYFQEKTGHPSSLWPAVAFVLIFIAVAFVVRILAKIIQKAFKLIMLGWLNRFCGILFYILAYTIIFSVLLWFIDQLGLLPYEAKANSVTYNRIAFLGPRAVHDIAGWMPWFKDIFQQLQNFFGEISPI